MATDAQALAQLQMATAKEVKPDPPEVPYIRHRQIRGAAFLASDDPHIDPDAFAGDEVGTFGPAEYQEIVNEVLDLLLAHCLAAKGAQH